MNWIDLHKDPLHRIKSSLTLRVRNGNKQAFGSRTQRSGKLSSNSLFARSGTEATVQEKVVTRLWLVDDRVEGCKGLDYLLWLCHILHA